MAAGAPVLVFCGRNELGVGALPVGVRSVHSLTGLAGVTGELAERLAVELLTELVAKTVEAAFGKGAAFQAA